MGKEGGIEGREGGKGKTEEWKKGGMEAGAGLGEGPLDLQSLKPEPAASTPGHRKEPLALLHHQVCRRGSGTIHPPNRDGNM